VATTVGNDKLGSINRKGYIPPGNGAPPPKAIRYVWRGKTYYEADLGHILGAIVRVFEVNSLFYADVWLYSVDSAPKNLLLVEKYLNEPLQTRVRDSVKPGKPGTRPEYGKNPELNFVLDSVKKGSNGVKVDSATVCERGHELRRRILLTASRRARGNSTDTGRTMRFVTSTYCSEPVLKSDECVDGSEVSESRTRTAKTYGATPCSDYPDDAVLFETEIEANYTGTVIDYSSDPSNINDWLDYDDWD